MIQRIQTIYLLATTVLIALIFVFPIAEYMDANNQIFQLNYLHFKSISENYIDTFVLPITILVGIIPLISLVTIFLFKNRNLQVKISNIILLLLFVLFAVIAFYVYKFSVDLGSKAVLKVSLLFPIIAIITTYLARFNIKKDINIIRSSDRIR